MFAVRVLVTCLCMTSTQCILLSQIRATTPTTQNFDVSAPPDTTDNDAGSPVETVAPKPTVTTEPLPKCEPESINVSVRNDRQPAVIDFTVVVNQPNNCDDYIDLVECDGLYLNKYIPFKEGGHACVRKKGSYKLRVSTMSKVVQSGCFNLSGTDLSHEDIAFINDGEASVQFQQLPRWAKGVNVNIFDQKTRTTVGRVTKQKTQKIVVPGNYTVNRTYELWYTPLMSEEGIECFGDNGLRRNEVTSSMYRYQQKPRVDAGHTKDVLIVGIIAGAFCLVLVVCAFLCRANNRDRNPSSQSPIKSHLPSQSPSIANKSVGDVVLVHAQDNNQLARLCQDLKGTITRDCGRRIVDIALTNVQRQTSPETWLLQVLSQQNNTVLLVLSPAMAALHRALQKGNDAAGCVAVAEERGEMRTWDVLLPICLRYLQDHLSQNYMRLFVVRFEQVSSGSSLEDISELVPAKRYLLPKHNSDLQRALKSRSSLA